MYSENNVVKTMIAMETVFKNCAEDAEKFVEGNNSAGTRVRKAMQEIENMAQEVRLEVQRQKNSVTV